MYVFVMIHIVEVLSLVKANTVGSVHSVAWRFVNKKPLLSWVFLLFFFLLLLFFWGFFFFFLDFTSNAKRRMTLILFGISSWRQPPFRHSSKFEINCLEIRYFLVNGHSKFNIDVSVSSSSACT